MAWADEEFPEFEFLLPGGRPRGRGVTIGAAGGGRLAATDVDVAVVEVIGLVVTVTVDFATGLVVVGTWTFGSGAGDVYTEVSVAVVPCGRL